MISDTNVATLEAWAANWDDGPKQLTTALIADWRWRGELLKAERLHIIELEIENAELVALRAELARLRSGIKGERK
jgi:hypothetical protein